jgi:hypothetical protein
MNICKYKGCKNIQVNGSDYCYCKSHYPNIESYQKVYDENLQIYMNDSINIDDFIVQETDPDGSCMYQSLVYSLFKNQENTHISENENFIQLMEDLENIESICRALQTLLRIWLMEHLDDTVPDFGDISVRDMILMFHQPDIESIEEYNKYYLIYAGDMDYLIDPITKKKSTIPTRWGSCAELYAFQQIFHINIYIYNKYRFVKRNMSVSQSSEKERNSKEYIFRYKIYNQLVNPDYVTYPEVNLLYSKNHYDFLERK